MKYFKHLLAALFLMSTVAANAYEVKYLVDRTTYASYTDIAEGDVIPVPQSPTKEGNRFLGWVVSSNSLNQIDIASNADAMLYSNAPCLTDEYGDQFTSWDVLFDNNTSTIFHSDYSNADSEDGLDHYLRVDMGEGNALSVFTFSFTGRDRNVTINGPKVIVVEGSNEANGEYTTIATLSDLPTENGASYESELLGNGNSYRYIRFRVTATHGGQEKGGHPFFFISEFAMYAPEQAPTTMPASDLTLSAMFKTYESDILADGIFYNIFDAEAKTVKVSACESSVNGYSGEINIPQTITHNDETYTVVGIEDDSFAGATGLTAVTIPTTITSINAGQFSQCTALASVTLPEGLTTIGMGAFTGTAIESITIPGSVTTMASAFSNCTALKSVTINEGVTTIGDKAFHGCQSLTDISIPNTVTAINQRAFQSCASLRSIDLPENLTHLGEAAIEFCSSLESFEIPEGVTEILYATFNGNTAMESVTLPSTLTLISDWAFKNCRSLTSIIIPQNVTTINGSEAFLYCTALKTVVNLSPSLTIEAGATTNSRLGQYADNVINAPNGEIVDTYIFTEVEGVNTLAGYIGNETELTLPSNYKGGSYVIGNNAFYGNTTITEVVMPNSVTSIGNKAFYDCTSLESINTPSSLTEIGEFAFCNCQSLRSFELPEGLTTIPYDAFYNCSSLTSIVIPTTVTTIGVRAFYGCTSLESINTPSSLTEIGQLAFYNCQSLRSFELPEGLTTIPYAAFYNCSSLTSIVIPTTVTTIGECAFQNCVNIEEITSKSTTPATIGNEYTFANLGSNTTTTLYVAGGCKSAYEAAEYWNTIPNIVELTFNLVYKIDGQVYMTEQWEYKAEITPADAPEKGGYNFIEWTGMPETMPRNDVEVNALYEQYAVAITIGQYGTTVYTSEHALDFTEVEGIKAYAATGYNIESGMITMTKLPTSDSGMGLFLKAEPGTYYVPIIDYSTDRSLNLLVGVLSRTIVNATSSDALYDYANYKYTIKSGDAAPKFYRYGDGSTVSAGKAYLQIPLSWVDSATAEAIDIRFEDGETTGVDEINGENTETVYYDLQGRRVDQPTNGIYIVNGKKVLIR